MLYLTFSCLFSVSPSILAGGVIDRAILPLLLPWVWNRGFLPDAPDLVLTLLHQEKQQQAMILGQIQVKAPLPSPVESPVSNFLINADLIDDEPEGLLRARQKWASGRSPDDSDFKAEAAAWERQRQQDILPSRATWDLPGRIAHDDRETDLNLAFAEPSGNIATQYVYVNPDIEHILVQAGTGLLRTGESTCVEVTSVENLPDSYIERELTCPICFQLMTIPQTACNSHIICKDCARKKSIICPVCEQGDHFYEASPNTQTLFQNSRFYCPNPNCHHVIPLPDLPQHLKACPHPLAATVPEALRQKRMQAHVIRQLTEFLEINLDQIQQEQFINHFLGEDDGTSERNLTSLLLKRPLTLEEFFKALAEVSAYDIIQSLMHKLSLTTDSLGQLLSLMEGHDIKDSLELESAIIRNDQELIAKKEIKGTYTWLFINDILPKLITNGILENSIHGILIHLEKIEALKIHTFILPDSCLISCRILTRKLVKVLIDKLESLPPAEAKKLLLDFFDALRENGGFYTRLSNWAIKKVKDI